MITTKFDRMLWKVPCDIPVHEQTRTVMTGKSFLRIRDTGGEKQPLIFLCDPPITVESYDELINCFQLHYRIIVMELPNFGFSRSLNSSVMTFEGAVVEVETAIINLKLETCVLFGPCICGFVAAELVSRSQIPISGLVLMQTADKKGMMSWLERMDPKGLLRIPFLGQLIVKLTARRMARFWLEYATAKESVSTDMVDKTDQALHHGGAFPLATMLQHWSKGTRNTDLEFPTLVFWGRQDRSHKETSPLSTCQHAANAEVIELADCGHFSELENPRQFANRTIPFINDCFKKTVSR